MKLGGRVPDSYEVVLLPSARRSMNRLPEAVAAAVYEMLHGPLAENPHRVGKPLGPPYEGRHGARRGDYRIIYRIRDDLGKVIVSTVEHRQYVYRRR